MRIAALLGILIAFLMTENTSGELRCPQQYCAMCSLPHGMTAEQVYGTRCRSNSNCMIANHLCCIRDTFGKFCTPGVEDTPRPGQCPAVTRLSFAERVRNCPADIGNRCSFDVDCQQDYKCCVTSCGHKQCTAPVVGQTVAYSRPPPTPQPSARPAVAHTTINRQIGARSDVATTRAATDARSPKQKVVEGSGSGGYSLRAVVERLRMKLAWLLERIHFWKEKSGRLRERLSASRNSAPAAVAKSRPTSATDESATTAAPFPAGDLH